MLNRPLNEIAAYQWQACQDIILADLAKIDSERWTTCAFDEFLSDPKSTIERLQQFAELTPDPALEAYCASPLPQSRYTHTPPAKGKWLQHKLAITQIFPYLKPTIDRINNAANQDWTLDTSIHSATEKPNESTLNKLSG
jgi:hypothetical protein